MEVHFYEKPGCINNTKQKKILAEKGYAVLAYNILTHEWTTDELKTFMSDRPLKEWFNMSAPRIKSGEVSITDFSEETALEAMVKDPFLIKRPLIHYKEKYGCGFDSKLATDLINGINVDSLLSCPKMAENNSCDDLSSK